MAKKVEGGFIVKRAYEGTFDADGRIILTPAAEQHIAQDEALADNLLVVHFEQQLSNEQISTLVSIANALACGVYANVEGRSIEPVSTARN